MNPNTHKYCKKCNDWHKHYNSSFTKCPRCEELKQLKDGKAGSIYKSSERSKGKVKSERAGRKVRKLTSEPREEEVRIGRSFREQTGLESVNSGRVQKKAYRIPKTTSKQDKINNAIATLKKNRITRLGSFCEACGRLGKVNYGHLIPRSKRKDLELDPDNAFLACWQCDFRFEHLLEPKEVLKFKNLNKILDYIESVDSARFIHISEKLNYQLIASR